MRLVCVTGMHRSGTSLVARILNLLGVDLGPEDAMMAATPDNPRGYWEAEVLSDLDNDIVEHLGGRWHRLPAFPDGWETDPDLDPFRDRAREALDDLFAGAEIAGFKDPRTSMLLPFWRTVHPIAGTVLVLRHPVEVAGSIARRDGFESEYSASLWTDHVAASSANDPDAVITTYRDLLDDPVAEARRMAERLRLPAPSDDVAAKIEAFRDPDLRHHTAEEVPPGEEMATAVGLYDLLVEDTSSSTLGLVAGLWERRNLVRVRDAEIHRQADEIRIHERDLRTALRERDDARDHLAREQEQRRTAEQRIRELEQQLNRKQNQLTNARRQAKRWETEYRILSDRRAVKLALNAAKPLKPFFEFVRDKRGIDVDPRKRATTGSDGPGDAGDKTRRKPHEPASEADAKALQARLEAEAPEPPATSGPHVSIVILTRDGEHHLRTCLPALARTEYDSFDLCVVDNASSDGSLAYLDEFAAQVDFDVQVIRNTENATFSAGNNQGIAATDGDLVLLLNNDIEPVEPHWLANLVDTLTSRDAAAVGARLIYPRRVGLDNAGDTVHPDLTLQHRGIRFDAPFDGIPRARNAGAGEDPLAAVARAVEPLPVCTAACLLVRRDHLGEVGGLTEEYVYGTEDVDLGLKLRAHGGDVVYDGRVALWHHEFGTQNEAGREAKRRNRLHNREVFVDTWGPRIFREVLADKIDGAPHWSLEPLHVAITVTKDDPAAGYGDYYTAHEFGDALVGLGWRVSYIEHYDDRWYDLDPSVDVVVAMLDKFDVHQIPRHVVTVAWVRNWADRWLEHGWFDDYDLVFASSSGIAEYLEERSSKAIHLLPLATNPDRFDPSNRDDALASQVLFVGSRWKKPRDIEQALPHLPRELDIALYGHGWDQHPDMNRLWRGPLEYERVPGAYAAADLVLDDTASHAKPFKAVNSRVFDALAAGTIVVTDNPDGVAELYDDEFPTWTDAADLETTVRRLLDDAGERARIVERYRTMTLERHTYAHRAETFRDVLRGWCEARRFGILIGAPRRDELEHWGDYHYARATQRELERAGHPTRVHILPEWTEAHTAQHDVIVHLFGLSEYTPRPGQTNVLWNISHPDLVTPEQADSYDLVCVASTRFAEQLASKVHVPVEPLLQATDPSRMRPGEGPHHELLFVANSRKTRRRIVDDLTPTDRDLAIYGREWTDDLVDPRYVKGELIPNRELHAYYASADIVLNDHWDDMREYGFLSNRLFDALACGAFVISDHLDEIPEVFGDTVVTYTDAADLKAKVDRYLADDEARRELAEKGRELVLAQHTFEHRIGELLGLVAPLLEAQPPAIVERSDVPATTRA